MKKLLAGAGMLLLLLTGCGENQIDGDYAELAQCLTNKGVKLYGTWWCHNCDNQKKLFGKAFQYIDYTECDEGGYEADPEACRRAGIRAYPSWVFPGLGEEPGTPLIITGTRSLEFIAETADCPIEAREDTQIAAQEATREEEQ